MVQKECDGGDDLVIANLHYSYGGALSNFNDFNLTVKPGEFLALLGSSGCGKNPLFNLLADFYTPEDYYLGYVFRVQIYFRGLLQLKTLSLV